MGCYDLGTCQDGAITHGCILFDFQEERRVCYYLNFISLFIYLIF